MRPFVVLALLSFAAPQLPAQAPILTVPRESPRAQVSQTVGLTDITVTYARPSVKGRKVWGGIVPFGAVWRAGANENTVVTFSTPVKVGSVSLPAGAYGLHMLPTATDWTVIFSSQSHAWGSFSYDAKEDAARVVVSPAPSENTERLTYLFEDPSETAVTLALHWEKLRVPIRMEVDTKQMVVASLRDQLRGISRFFPESWSAAAGWCVQNDVNLDESLAWVNRSLGMKETFNGYRVKAALLEKSGDAKTAEALRGKAMTLATEIDVNNLGYAQLGQGKVDEALATFQKNVKDHPASWNSYDSLAEAYAVKGEKSKAIQNYAKALEMVDAEDQRVRIRGELAKLRNP